LAKEHPSPYVVAAAALARGRVCLAAGTGDPHSCLREAISGFTLARLPRELAQARLALAHALVVDSPEAATAEARAALEGFDALSATRDAAEAAAVLRSLGVATTSVRADGELLTKRETEVLDLLGHGLSNPEISDRLFISRKTVEHHVGNVLSKLGLRTRAAAAAHAARGKPGPK
jgi:DNA-binding NarL/FixJ family response regulator